MIKIIKRNKLEFILITTMVVVLTVGAFIGIHHNNLLHHNNIKTIACVTSRSFDSRFNDYINYEFYACGKKYEGQKCAVYFEVENKTFFNVGDSLYVYYYPPDPSISNVDFDDEIIKDGGYVPK
jgi:hypothetical protein